eukprot:Gregarina_sp_Poly_1__6326@NODE_3365_length_1150_cov_86_052632_g2128_i0_p1_GENE_NODE_3365_length_1150_cov_86_052632_g2128_i0NODE_3365_length_1150_cov_86_052632_g2128_i0_p1_ORF_typecomplete_len286_score59_29WD40_like/PF17005_5/2_5e05WD40_like/PF17005_5/0_047WD40_like/PF17005_5/0_38ANAPC4_WD40/PF12894_7/0_0053ANAPC4_WD40/PF12894_7/0_025ANAPC4_WD40/PF12894_7/1e02ANAPC4_WD40/PF12894_7/58ANAPC4_WD40/PF12894_7/3_4WD40/PF00400_32/0_029WD40/PF00400_32/31WD40/PF00400_32/2_2e03WD40/PF00400_32/1_3e03VID27/P
MVKVFELQSQCERFALDANDGEGVTKMRWISSEVLVSGTDDGTINLWDKRLAAPLIATISECDDQIFDLAVSRSQQFLLATSGDKLAVFDLRKPKANLYAMSDELEDDLLCMNICGNETRVVCGTNSGPLGVFHFGDFGDIKERITGFKSSTNCAAVLNEDLLLVGSDGGRVEVVSVYPSAYCGVLCTQSTSQQVSDNMETDEGSGSEEQDSIVSGGSEDLSRGMLSIDSLSIDKDRMLVATASTAGEFVNIHSVSRALEMQEQVKNDRKDVDLRAAGTNFFADI